MCDLKVVFFFFGGGFFLYSFFLKTLPLLLIICLLVFSCVFDVFFSNLACELWFLVIFMPGPMEDWPVDSTENANQPKIRNMIPKTRTSCPKLGMFAVVTPVKNKSFQNTYNVNISQIITWLMFDFSWHFTSQRFWHGSSK